MTSAAANRTLHPPRTRTIFLFVMSAIAAGVAMWTYTDNGWTMTSGSAAVVTLLMFLGCLDFLTTRVQLTDDAMQIRSNFRTRVYPRHTLTEVRWSRGSAIAVKLTSGEWIQLPDVGNAHSVANTIRAWLRG